MPLTLPLQRLMVGFPRIAPRQDGLLAHHRPDRSDRSPATMRVNERRAHRASATGRRERPRAPRAAVASPRWGSVSSRCGAPASRSPGRGSRAHTSHRQILPSLTSASHCSIAELSASQTRVSARDRPCTSQGQAKPLLCSALYIAPRRTTATKSPRQWRCNRGATRQELARAGLRFALGLAASGGATSVHKSLLTRLHTSANESKDTIHQSVLQRLHP